MGDRRSQTRFVFNPSIQVLFWLGLRRHQSRAFHFSLLPTPLIIILLEFTRRTASGLASLGFPTMKNPRPKTVAVVGSGMAGLATAYLLNQDPQRRFHVNLLEKVSGTVVELGEIHDVDS